MSEAVEIPDPVMYLIEQLKNRSDKKPIDVLTILLDYYNDVLPFRTCFYRI